MAVRVMVLMLALTGCSSPCRLTVDYLGDWQKPLYPYDFQPGINCVY